MTIYLKRGDKGTRGDGAKGDWIVSWQSFLAGEDHYEGDYSPNFGPRTEAATRRFQDSLGYLGTGNVTRNELMPALNKGFDPPDSWLKAALAAGDIVQENVDKLTDDPGTDSRHDLEGPIISTYLNPLWPQPVDLDGDGRADLVYLGEDGRQALWGPLEYGVIDGKPVLANDWLSKFVRKVHVPQLVGVDCYGSPSKGNVQFHKLAAAQLLGAFQEVEEAGLKDLLLTYGGSYNMRFIRDSLTTLSNHAFGVALDLNMKWNGLGKQAALVGQEGSLRQFVPIFERWGFFWGGWYRNRKDGMHFECVKRLTEQEVLVMAGELSKSDHILEALKAAA